jgi:hypothetical protein
MLYDANQIAYGSLIKTDSLYNLLCVPKIRFGVDAASGRRKLAS